MNDDDLYTTLTGSPGHALGSGDPLKDMIRAKGDWDFRESMAGSVVNGSRCKCPPGYVEVITHLDSDEKRKRWNLDEAMALFEGLRKVLFGVRWCRACGESCWPIADRPRLSLLGGWPRLL